MQFHVPSLIPETSNVSLIRQVIVAHCVLAQYVPDAKVFLPSDFCRCWRKINRVTNNRSQGVSVRALEIGCLGLRELSESFLMVRCVIDFAAALVPETAHLYSF